MMKNIAADPAYSETKRAPGGRLMKVLRDTHDPRLDDAFDRPPYVATAAALQGSQKEMETE